MTNLFFFTDVDSLTASQSANKAFGPVPGSELAFNVQNEFDVVANASAVAITDGIPFIQQCATSSDCVNLILFPLKSTPFDFPKIKFFIYRGLKKTALFAADNIIKSPDSTWKTYNILQVLHDLQDKINEATGETNEPMSENIGYHYSVSTDPNFKADTEFIESTIFLNDAVQLPLVKAGCHIGKFVGGSTTAGFQIVLDRVGYEPTLEIARKANHQIVVDPLVDGTNIARFKHFHQKEAILTYVDPAALYGVSKANDKKVKIFDTISDSDDSKVDATQVIELFNNKNICYIDIRNNQNYSFDYYDNFGKEVILGFENAAGDDFDLETIDYYDDWPIIRLIDKSVNADKILMRLPFKRFSDNVTDYFLSSYTHEFLPKGNSKSKFIQLNQLGILDNFRLRYCEDIELNAWFDDGDLLGANYFSFKYGIQSNDLFEATFGEKIFEATFPLDMKLLLGDDNLDDGDFKVYTYASTNAPILLKKGSVDEQNNIYVPHIGIAEDKDHVTFFSFADRTAYSSTGASLNFPFSIIKSGNYENSVYLDEFEYDPSEKSIGFLSALPYRLFNQELKLMKLTQDFPVDINTTEERDYLYYLNAKPKSQGRFFVDTKTIDCITITKDEYQTIKNIATTEFDPKYRTYLSLRSTNSSIFTEDENILVDFQLEIKGIDFLSSEDQVISKTFNLEQSGDEIRLNGVITKS